MQEHARKVTGILTSSISQRSLYDDKQWTFGYITALANTGQISQEVYRYLRDTISMWKLGDTQSKMVTPVELR